MMNKKISLIKNFTEGYELTHGDIHFYGKEVEVFQILFIE